MPGTKDLIAGVERSITESPALLLQNHGLVTYGATLREAANAALALEEVCKLMLECRAHGKEPTVIPETAVELPKKFIKWER
ncbi:MAG: class II aldolase/adducin family protein [Firmicutes bacterium]|nr:class II aldolase/adducin family protein [Candidatus Fermentithermobacillaceae bacterium]